MHYRRERHPSSQLIKHDWQNCSYTHTHTHTHTDTHTEEAAYVISLILKAN